MEYYHRNIGLPALERRIAGPIYFIDRATTAPTFQER